MHKGAHSNECGRRSWRGTGTVRNPRTWHGRCSLSAAERQRHIGAGSLVGLFVPSACSSHKTRVRNEGLDLTSEITKTR